MSEVITHPIPEDYPINHKSFEEAVNIYMFIYPIWKTRIIYIIYFVNLVDAQGRNPKCLISNPSPALLQKVILS
jgi:hypothetical protein